MYVLSASWEPDTVLGTSEHSQGNRQTEGRRSALLERTFSQVTVVMDNPSDLASSYTDCSSSCQPSGMVIICVDV